MLKWSLCHDKVVNMRQIRCEKIRLLHFLPLLLLQFALLLVKHSQSEPGGRSLSCQSTLCMCCLMCQCQEKIKLTIAAKLFIFYCLGCHFFSGLSERNSAGMFFLREILRFLSLTLCFCSLHTKNWKEMQ